MAALCEGGPDEKQAAVEGLKKLAADGSELAADGSGGEGMEMVKQGADDALVEALMLTPPTPPAWVDAAARCISCWMSPSTTTTTTR